jgi:hypothetical protein
MVPIFDQSKTKELPFSIIFLIFGLLDGSTMMLIFLIGPLLIAANHRITYEITSGGTMIGIVISFSYFLGSCLGVIIISICGSIQSI